VLFITTLSMYSFITISAFLHSVMQNTLHYWITHNAHTLYLLLYKENEIKARHLHCDK